MATDRLAELEDEESFLTRFGKEYATLNRAERELTQQAQGAGQNPENPELLTAAALATVPLPGARIKALLESLKLARGTVPALDQGIMQMANKGRTYGGGFSKPGFTQIRGGGRKNTFKTRNPKEWNVYTDIARFSDGGASPHKLTPQQVDQLRAIMPKLRAAASSQTRHGRTTMNNVVRMFDDNFK